jgi:hypothetical protein
MKSKKNLFKQWQIIYSFILPKCFRLGWWRCKTIILQMVTNPRAVFFRQCIRHTTSSSEIKVRALIQANRPDLRITKSWRQQVYVLTEERFFWHAHERLQRFCQASWVYIIFCIICRTAPTTHRTFGAFSWSWLANLLTLPPHALNHANSRWDPAESDFQERPRVWRSAV